MKNENFLNMSDKDFDKYIEMEMILKKNSLTHRLYNLIFYICFISLMVFGVYIMIFESQFLNIFIILILVFYIIYEMMFKVLKDLEFLESLNNESGSKRDRNILLKHNYTEDEIERFFNIRLKMIRLYEIIYMTKY